MFKIILLVAIAVCLFTTAKAGTIDAASVDLADVRAAVHAAKDGDTVTIPAGTASWTDGLSITKAIILKGTGASATIITMDMPTTSGKAINWNVARANAANQRPRLTGIYFKMGSRPAGGNQFVFQGSNTNGCKFRWDNCKVDTVGQIAVKDMIGVCDSTDFIETVRTPIFHVYHEHWNGGTWADLSWKDPIIWNSDQFWYIEDCHFYNPHNFGVGITDNYRGGRCVFRHCTFENGLFVGTHGPDTGGGRARGNVALAFYDNDTYNQGSRAAITDLRSGIEIAYNNKAHINPGVFTASAFSIPQYRSWMIGQGGFGGADGQNQFDNNDVTGGTSGGPIFLTGTTSSSSDVSPDRRAQCYRISTSNTLTPHQWIAYALRNTGGTSTSYDFAVIVDNGTNWIDYIKATFKGPMTFGNGDSYAIRHVNHSHDCSGYHGGKGVHGNPPVPDFPRGENDQVLMPCYFWNNVKWDDTAGKAVATLVATTNNPVLDDVNAPGVINPHIKNGVVPPQEVYTAYVYPHPLRGGTANVTPTPVPSPTATGTSTPAPTATLTPTPTWTPTPTVTPTTTHRPSF